MVSERQKEIKKKLKATQFRKGDRPANEMPVGAIVVNSYGYKLRKKQMQGTQWERWEFLHRAVWEEQFGPVPDGMVVTFKDGNRLNCEISNLMLATKGEMAVMAKKGYKFEDPDLTETALNMVRLQISANKKRRKQ